MSLRATWTWELGAAREPLWEYLADTDWVNEHAGLPRISVRFEPQAAGLPRRVASFRRGPVLVEWEERPTLWQAPEYFTVERLYRHGPLARFFARTSLEPLAPDRTRVTVELELTAASRLLAPFLPAMAAHGRAGAERAFRLAATLAARRPAPPQANGSLGGFAALPDAGADPRVADAIAGFVESAENRDLQRMRPYELADRWQLPRRDVLRGFLTATRVGLFNLSWSVLCPACRGASSGVESLALLRSGYHCEACNLPFDAAFDRSVEVTFDARPLGRFAEQGVFCIASPRRSAHVYAQAVLAPQAERSFALALPKGGYDINVVGVGVAPFVASEGESARQMTAVVGASGGIEAPDAIASGEVCVAVDNQLDRESIVRIEDGRWPDTIATAAQVTALQEFRDLFSSQVLAPGLEMGIETMAILFTDLVGSTAMYSRTGDAPAFRIVTDHFDVVREIVARRQGAIVKTIGDAVMAAFVDPQNCLEAALELDDRVQTILVRGEPLRLRAGFHAGPCIAMRANDRVDYFGTTVNLASRLQALADAGEVSLARTVAERPPIAQRLRELGRPLARETLAIKGFTQPIDVVRIVRRA